MRWTLFLKAPTKEKHFLYMRPKFPKPFLVYI